MKGGWEEEEENEKSIFQMSNRMRVQYICSVKKKFVDRKVHFQFYGADRDLNRTITARVKKKEN